MTARWQTPEQAGSLPPPPVWRRTYTYQPGDVVDTEDGQTGEVASIWPGYVTLMTDDGDLLHVPHHQLSPHVVTPKEAEIEAMFLAACDRHRGQRIRASVAEVCSCFAVLCVCSVPFALIVAVAWEAGRRFWR